jgi:RHS repeat-associated protein
MGRRLRFGATLLLVSALLAPMARADEAAAPLDAAAMAALGIARPVRPEAGPWNWTTGNYAYDASGNITAIGTQSFAYDTRGRLVDAILVRPDQPGSEHETFAYDAFGNMTSRTGASAYSVVTPASLATNHLVGATYDGAGNVTLLTPPGQAFQYEYTYDALGSLNQARAANVAGETRQFSIYTADDERIWTYDLGVNTSHWKIRDLGGRVLRDYVVTGDTWQLSRDYVYRGEQLLSAVTPAETLSFSLDHLGTPRVITRADRTLAGFHHYLPYGEEWTNGTAAQDGETKKFTSHERDRDPSGTGANELDYMHARFYSAEVGRFLSVDPTLVLKTTMPNPQMWNRYSYVVNNPLRFTDPDGRYGNDGLTLPMTPENLAMDENTPWVVKGAFYAEGALLGMAAAGEAIAANAPRLFALAVRATPLLNFLRNCGAGETGQPSLTQFERATTQLANDLRFTETTLGHMKEAGRMVPRATLAQAILTGTRSADPQGAPGAIQVTQTITKNGKNYLLQIIYRETDNMILHFSYAAAK